MTESGPGQWVEVSEQSIVLNGLDRLTGLSVDDLLTRRDESEDKGEHMMVWVPEPEEPIRIYAWNGLRPWMGVRECYTAPAPNIVKEEWVQHAALVNPFWIYFFGEDSSD